MWVYQNKLPCENDNVDLEAVKSMLCVDVKTRPNVKEVIRVSLDFGPNLLVISELSFVMIDSNNISKNFL